MDGKDYFNKVIHTELKESENEKENNRLEDYQINKDEIAIYSPEALNDLIDNKEVNDAIEKQEKEKKKKENIKKIKIEKKKINDSKIKKNKKKNKEITFENLLERKNKNRIKNNKSNNKKIKEENNDKINNNKKIKINFNGR